MRRFALLPLLLALFVGLAALPDAASADPSGSELAQGNLMQCMEQCIRAEGKA